jgi:lipopolysaccharide transport system ATP-binding protein
LLEVGTGFHPELTGHENVYLYGAILGMDRWEVTRKFDEIIAFAEIEKFIDTPIKRYSSGMYMRLAFAVAAHMETEILLVDEVLAVGDIAFQKKCMGKMGDVSKEGRTVLFVSHNLLSILQLCSRCILLQSGELINDGHTNKVTAQYINQVNDHSEKGEVRFDNKNIAKKNNGKAIIVSLRTLDDKGHINSSFQIYQSITFDVELDNLSQEGIVFTFFIRNNYDAIVYHIRSQDSGIDLRNILGKVKIRTTIPELKIVEGKYTVDLWLGNHLNQLETLIEKAISFEVINKGQSRETLQSVIHETGVWTLVR